ncbi:cAMP-binding protein [Cavenderia fasciculata]|uniref:cAMP-binding protein n=1 Tax=Cavenderia fasciculata TaxID=261658 RepID=F4Q3M8_CACFS|nr:cAMP-binding protein [Cavenderia fasciculata]EGG17686.1 cAMP-binding protein [Cavenderia fasciculata]|eukprot:XP_004356170.1 cAMP-binding protein [Cavenderia fasciculata]
MRKWNPPFVTINYIQPTITKEKLAFHSFTRHSFTIVVEEEEKEERRTYIKMYNPPPPQPPAGKNSYYRQPNSTPNVGAPGAPTVPNFAVPPPSTAKYPPGPPPAGQYPPPPPPSAPGAGQYPPPPPPGGQFTQPGQYPTPAPGQYGAPGGQFGGAPPAGISLVKDQTISLSKEDPYLRRVFVGLGWDVNQIQGYPFDLDAVVFMLSPSGMVRASQDFIFYNNKVSRDGSVSHQGDNLTGYGEGDDETVTIDLGRVSTDVCRLVFAVSIHDAEQRRQTFQQVPRAFIRIANQETGRNICRFDLSNEGGSNTALIAGEVYRDGPEWKFAAVGKSFPGGLRYLCQMFGVTLG